MKMTLCSTSGESRVHCRCFHRCIQRYGPWIPARISPLYSQGISRVYECYRVSHGGMLSTIPHPHTLSPPFSLSKLRLIHIMSFLDCCKQRDMNMFKPVTVTAYLMKLDFDFENVYKTFLSTLVLTNDLKKKTQIVSGFLHEFFD